MTGQCRTLCISDYDDARTLYETLSTGHSLPPHGAGIAAFRTLLGHPGTWIVGAELGNRIVSMATLHVLPNMTYHTASYALVENVATLPAHQGTGLGRQVMAAVANKAWSEGAYKIMLLTDRGRGATGFYEKLGYVSDEKDGMILRRAWETL